MASIESDLERMCLESLAHCFAKEKYGVCVNIDKYHINLSLKPPKRARLGCCCVVCVEYCICSSLACRPLQLKPREATIINNHRKSNADILIGFLSDGLPVYMYTYYTRFAFVCKKSCCHAQIKVTNNMQQFLLTL